MTVVALIALAKTIQICRGWTFDENPWCSLAGTSFKLHKSIYIYICRHSRVCVSWSLKICSSSLAVSHDFLEKPFLAPQLTSAFAVPCSPPLQIGSAGGPMDRPAITTSVDAGWRSTWHSHYSEICSSWLAVSHELIERPALVLQRNVCRLC